MVRGLASGNFGCRSSCSILDRCRPPRRMDHGLLHFDYREYSSTPLLLEISLTSSSSPSLVHSDTLKKNSGHPASNSPSSSSSSLWVSSASAEADPLAVHIRPMSEEGIGPAPVPSPMGSRVSARCSSQLLSLSPGRPISPEDIGCC